MKEYQLQLKVRNNFLLQAMAQNGYKNAAELSRASGVSQTNIGNILNLTLPVFSQKLNDFIAPLKQLAEHLKCLPEDLVPEQHYHTALKSNVAEVEVGYDQVQKLLNTSAPDPLDLLIMAEEDEAFDATINKVVEESGGRFSGVLGTLVNDESVSELAKAKGVTTTTIYSYQAHMLRACRNPRNSETFRDRMYGESK